MAQCLPNSNIARPEIKSVTPPPPSLALPSPSLKSSPTTQLDVATPSVTPAAAPSSPAQTPDPPFESYAFCTCKPIATPTSSAEHPHPPALCPSCLKTFKRCEKVEREDHHLTSFPPLQGKEGDGSGKEERKGSRKESGVLGFGKILGALARGGDEGEGDRGV